MKEYRVSLEVATSLAVTGCEVADVLGVPRSALVEERVKRGLVWRYEPSTGQTGRLEDRIGQLTSEICPRRALPRGGGFRRVSLGIDVLYDTANCTVRVPLNYLVYGPKALAKKIPELSSVEFRCALSEEDLVPSHPTWEAWRKMAEEWEAAGRPRAARAPVPLVVDHSQGRPGSRESKRNGNTDSNKYIVSLDAITPNSTSASLVGDVLGLPPEALTSRGIRDGEAILWSCYVEADETVGLVERLRLLTSSVHPRREAEWKEVQQIFLDIGVIYDASKSKPCFVRLPISGLRALVRKLFVMHVEVQYYPSGGGEDDEEEC